MEQTVQAAGVTDVKLRLHYGGTFKRSGDNGEWRYVGGTTFNDKVPTHFTYSELAQRLNLKFGDTVSFRYQGPGEDLDPEDLVAVQDDDDLKELIHEYFEALSRPGTPLKTYRIKVFIFPALQTGYEVALADPAVADGEDMEASMYEADGTNFESWCSEDLSYSSNRSVQPSTDTEMLVAGHAAMLGVQGQARQPHGYMYGMARLQHGSTVLPQEATGTAEAVAAGTEPDHVPEMWHPYGPEQQALEQHALGNLTRSVQAYPTPAKETPPTAMLVTRGFTAEDFDLDDPYHEPDDGDKQHHMHHHNYHGTQMNPNGVSHLPHSITGLPVRQDQETTQLGPRFSQHVYGAGGPAHAVQEQQQPQPEASNGYGIGLQHSIYRELHDSRGEPLLNRPLARVRDAASGLPSHISAFGDMSGGSGGVSPGAGARSAMVAGKSTAAELGTAADHVGSVRLPSHISAFGEGQDEEDAEQQIAQEAHEAERAHMQQLYGDKGFGNRPHNSKVITQEFQANGSSLILRDGKPDLGALDLMFPPNQPTGLDALFQTPKALLDSVPHVPKGQVNVTSKIGEGAFGEVSRAEVFPYGTVAIKWLKRDRLSKYSESFQREAEVLSRLNHPNIIRMFGLVSEPQESALAGNNPGNGAQRPDAAVPAAQQQLAVGRPGNIIVSGIIMEYVRGGSLAQRMRAASASTRRFSLRERCRIALQAALGMSYLHDQQPAVIHFDLKPDNLLIEGEGDDVLVKVADFGLSKHKFQTYVTCHDLRGTLPYMAPELVANPTKVCEKCDVWSMGVVMWEMFTLQVPFQELTAQQILMGLMQGSLHLRMPHDCEPEWLGLVEACMEPNPERRPTFKELAAKLESIGRASMSQISSGHPSVSVQIPASPALPTPGLPIGTQTPAAMAAVAAAMAASNQQQQHAVAAQQQAHAQAVAAVAAAAAQHQQNQQLMVVYQQQLAHQAQQVQQQQQAVAVAGALLGLQPVQDSVHAFLAGPTLQQQQHHHQQLAVATHQQLANAALVMGTGQPPNALHHILAQPVSVPLQGLLL